MPRAGPGERRPGDDADARACQRVAAAAAIDDDDAIREALWAALLRSLLGHGQAAALDQRHAASTPDRAGERLDGSRLAAMPCCHERTVSIDAMTLRPRSSELAGGARAFPDLPSWLCEDQGALSLRADAHASLTAEPAGLVAGLVGAIDRRLHMGARTLDDFSTAAPLLRTLPASHKGELLLELLLCSNPAAAVDLAVRTQIMRQIIPDMDRLRAMSPARGRYKDVYAHTLLVIEATPPDPITRMAALLHDIAKPDTLVVENGAAHFPNHDLIGADRVFRRLSGLNFDQTFVRPVATLVRLHLRANSYERNWTDSAVRRLLLDAGDNWERLLALSYADVTSARGDVVARARKRVHELAEHARGLDKPVEVSPLDGDALMERFGRGPGRWIGDVKRALVAQVKQGDLDPADHEATWQVAADLVAALSES